LGHDASELPNHAAQAPDGAPLVLATGRHRLMVRPLNHGSLDGGRLLMLLPAEYT
jgi:hypothetical protein